MNLSIEKRIAALEAKLRVDPVTLVMQDGSTHILRGTVKHFFALFDAASRRYTLKVPTQWDAELDLIRDCVEIHESGGHLFELVKACVNGPAPTPTESGATE